MKIAVSTGIGNSIKEVVTETGIDKSHDVVLWMLHIFSSSFVSNKSMVWILLIWNSAGQRSVGGGKLKEAHSPGWNSII